jgi:hypothetical protein
MVCASDLGSSAVEKRQDAPTTIRRRFTLLLGIGVAGLSAAALFWPWTNAWMIHTRSHIVGASLVYASLAHSDDRWAVVLRGVRSGDPAWLHVAADLSPALDTHPGEEMLAAVSVAFDANPGGALAILVPTFGANMVCGRDETGAHLASEKAKERLETLMKGNQVLSADAASCARAISQSLAR